LVENKSRLLLAVFYCFLAVALSQFMQTAVHANSSQLPFDRSKPYALVAGDKGHLMIFDGQKLYLLPQATSADLSEVKWRHDGAYALAVGKNNTILKIMVNDNGVVIQPITSPLESNSTLETVTWKSDDSSALIAGPGGKFLVYDGQNIFAVKSRVTEPIYASQWSPDQHQNLALLVGQEGLIAEYNGTSTRIVDPHPTNDSFFAVGWNPTGSYALVGGDHAKLFKYQGGIFTEQNTAVLFEVAPHLIRSISYNPDNGLGLITGQLGLTVLASETKCDYSIFNNPDTTCLGYKRIQYYNDLNGTKVDLHHIGHFWSAGWMPGTQDAYAVGTALDGCLQPSCVRGWTIARITSNDVTLVLQYRKGSYSFRSIAWQPSVRASSNLPYTWYAIASGGLGFAAIVLITKRKTVKGWFGNGHIPTGHQARLEEIEAN
jgi:hypothetical protein